MCLFSAPKVETPKMPPRYAQQRSPDGDATRGAGRRALDRARAVAGTVLTSGSGVLEEAQTQQKTLLGA